MTQPPSQFGEPQRLPGFVPSPWQQPARAQYPVRSSQSSFGGWGGQQPQWPQGGGGPAWQPMPSAQQGFGQQYGPPPGQFGSYDQGWQQQSPATKRPTGLLVALSVAGLFLAGLLGYVFLGGGSGPDDPLGPTYQNEDYKLPNISDRVPDLPIPRDSQIQNWLNDNKLYAQTLASPVRCQVDRGKSNRDDELEKRMTALVECLTRVWGPALQKTGFIDYQPKLTVYAAGSKVNTRCGTQPSLNAFYCGADQNIYLASDITRILPAAQASERFVFDLIIAHEYGHAMQGRSGLFAASKLATADATKAESYQYSRRSEVQADCFAGLAVNSISQALGVTEADRAAMSKITYEIGDDRIRERFKVQADTPGDHGIGDNRKLWVERGLATSNIGMCNSFTAPGSEVE